MDRETLARLEVLNQVKLTDSQKEDVLFFFAKREEERLSLNAIDASETEPMVHVFGGKIELREDEIVQTFPREFLLAQAPATDVGYFCVPRVID